MMKSMIVVSEISIIGRQDRRSTKFRILMANPDY